MSEMNSLRWTETTVVKSGLPRLIALEAEKSLRAGRIGKETGLFRVPEVLDLDEAKGVAVYERIIGLRTLDEIGLQGPPGAVLAEGAARALAAVHRDLTLPPAMMVPLPEEIAAPGRDVVLHGDYGLKNIGLAPGSDLLVVLDWQFTDMHGGMASCGTRYFDVVWFVNNLLWAPRPAYLFGDPVRPLARAFVRTYFEAAGLPYDAEGLAGYARRYFAFRVPGRPKEISRRYHVYIPRCHALTRRFLRSLAMDHPPD